MNATKKWAKRSVWITLVAVSLIGCNPIQTIGFIFRDDPKVQPKYPLRPKEGAKNKKDEEISVLVLCDQRPGLPADEFAGADRELADNISRLLPDMAKANKERLKVVPAGDLANFQAKHPGWKKSMTAIQIGKALQADCVIDIHILSANLYQPGTNKQLYDAKADLEVNVYDLTGEKPQSRYYPLHFDYKPNLSPDAGNTNLSLYRQGYLEMLAKKICFKHIEHPSSEEIDP